VRLSWPLIGRSEEVRTIEAALSASDVAGALICGASGVGKSRIAREVLARAASEGCETRWTVGSSSAQAIPLGAFTAWAPSGVTDTVQLLRGVVESLTGPSVAPLNLVADFGGGSMFVLLGIVAALYERERSGEGQVIDAAMVDGVSILAQMAWTMKSIGTLKDERESFMLDGGAPFYRTNETADGKYMAVGAIEPQFFAQLLAGLGLSTNDVPSQLDASAFPKVHELFEEQFAGKTRDEWTDIFAGTDACVTPVLTWREAAQNEHLRARSTLVTANGVDQAAPAPRFSRTPSGPVGSPPKAITPIDEINW
jgi:crotonobetainyl-CoA:carnitine CoA-transferase CaiB-like acyl-CoA transferase